MTKFFERVVKQEIQPHLDRNRERNMSRHLNNKLWTYSESIKTKYKHNCSCGMISLIKSGMTYEKAQAFFEAIS